MLDAVMAVVAVLVGAVATFVIQEWRAERDRREVLLKRYLAQLQDACESLWYRLRNLAFEHADTATDPDYLVTTTMYTLGRALGIERMLALEGLYPEIWKRFPMLKSALRRRALDDAVEATTKKAAKSLQHYDRVALAEAVVERDDETFQQSTFLEFRRRVEGTGPEREWWEPARESVAALKNEKSAVKPLMTELRTLAVALSPVTKMETSLESEPDVGGEPHARHEVRTAAPSTRQSHSHDVGRPMAVDADTELDQRRGREPQGRPHR
jgi:hypothetical protein